MFRTTYEEMVRFASTGKLEEELPRAKKEFTERTGDLFESDPSFERRIASFLEWYILDRPVSFASHMTPAKLYIDSVSAELTTPELTVMRGLTKTVLSIFDYRGAKGEHLEVLDLTDNRRHGVFERRKPVGLKPGDLLEARLVPYHGKLFFTESVGVCPREVRRVIAKSAKTFRKQGNGTSPTRVDWVHRVAYFSNRCERYGHVDPKQIFAEL